MQQAEDFRAEARALAAVSADLNDADFATVTQFKNWTIGDVIGHLHMFDVAAELSGTNPEALGDFLKPVFAAIADDFIAFIGDAKLVIHNASFDMKFLNAELTWCGKPRLETERAIDTLAIARRKFPGAQASLDALCRRFNIDNSARELHGALLDSEILADVYLELIGGRQPDLVGAGPSGGAGQANAGPGAWKPTPRPKPLPSRLSAEALQKHEAFVDSLGDAPVWRRAR